MGELIRIDSHRRPIPGQVQPVGEAKIYMFTGVRYERTANPVEKSSSNGADGNTPPRKSTRG